MNRKNGPKCIASSSASEPCSPQAEARPNHSGFQSFLKWFKKNERDRLQQQQSQKSQLQYTTENNSIAPNLNITPTNGNGIYDNSDINLAPIAQSSSNSSSCDSIYSTATLGFAFIPPQQYKPYGNAIQPEKLIAPGPITDTYRQRIRAHQQAKEAEKDLTLRKKYHIFDADTLTSIDTTRGGDTLTQHQNRSKRKYINLQNQTNQYDKETIAIETKTNRYYTDLSLPAPQSHCSFEITDENSSANEDNNNSNDDNLNGAVGGCVTNVNYQCRGRRKSHHHRRTVSDSSKDKKAGAYVHVKGKRKAPKPPDRTSISSSSSRSQAKSLSPTYNIIDNSDYYGTLSPGSTLGRKKRRAPQPPPRNSSPLPSLTDEVPIILQNGLLDDAEIQAIITGNTKNNFNTVTTTTDIIPFTCSSNKMTSDDKLDIPIAEYHDSDSVQCTDTLRLERGILKSNRDCNNLSPPTSIQSLSPPPLSISPISQEDIPNSPTTVTRNCVSPISPRPWYKRASSGSSSGGGSGVGKDHYSIPFKREVTLKTMEKRKGKHALKESSPQLPEVGFSRNSSLFDGFFSRVTSSIHHHQHHNHDKSTDQHEKRLSGIKMPNISELDREAAEIVSKEQEKERQRLQAEREKYFSSPPNTEDVAPTEIEGQRTSTKDLISKFEETNQVKFTINTAFVEKADHYFDKRPVVTASEQKQYTSPQHHPQQQQPLVLQNKENDINKNRNSMPQQTTTSSLSSSVSSSSSSSMTQSIFSNLRNSQTATTTLTSMTTTTVTSTSTTMNPLNQTTDNNSKLNSKNNNSKTDTNIVGGINTATNLKNKWVCAFCTLENYNWRVICEVCERIKPYEHVPVPISSPSPTSVVTSPNTSQADLNRVRYIKNDQNKHKSNVNTVTSPSAADTKDSMETKTEKMLKYFRPKNSSGSTSNLLSKSASETSVGHPFTKKSSSSTSKLMGGSPKLTLRQKQSDIIRTQLPNHQTNRSESSLAEERKRTLIDSSAVLKTTTAVFIAPLPINHDNDSMVNNENMSTVEQVRAARIAKFVDTKNLNDVPAEKTETKPIIIVDAASLEREKERLREIIRSMNARAMAEKYPIIKKASSLDESELTPILPAEIILPQQPQLENSINPQTNITPSSNNKDPNKLGAIKKLFQRSKTIDEPEDKIISDSSNYTINKKLELDLKNYSNEKSSISTSGAVGGAIPKFSRPDVLNLLPTPILELNESDISSPAVTGASAIRTTSEWFVDKQINSIYDNLKNSMTKETSSDIYLDRVINFEDISHQLYTAKGLEDFKATMKTSPKLLTNTNTLALNKIFKNLEEAISSGKHEMAAKLAVDLAKMKVPLSVTKQHQQQQQQQQQQHNDHDESQKEKQLDLKENQSPTEDKPTEIKSVMVDLFIEDKEIHRGPIHLQLHPSITVNALKRKIAKDYNIPMDIQQWILNDSFIKSDLQVLSEFNLKDYSILYLYVTTPMTVNNNITVSSNAAFPENSDPMLPTNENNQGNKKISNITELTNKNYEQISEDIKIAKNDDEEQEGAKALPLIGENKFGTLKFGWTCPLCTLINSPNRPGCVACSTTRPISYIIPDEYKVHDHSFEIPEELRKFLDDEDTDTVAAATITTKSSPEKVLPQQCTHQRNDLSKSKAVNRKSAEIFNIIVKEEDGRGFSQSSTSLSSSGQKQVVERTANKPLITKESTISSNFTPNKANTTSIIMTAITSSPNITKNKYRGVDNYNPQLVKPKPIPNSLSEPYKSPLARPVRMTATKFTPSPDIKTILAKVAAKKPIERRILPTTVGAASDAHPNIPTITKKVNSTVVSPPPSRISQHYTELLNLDNFSVVTNSEAFECPVCLLDIEAGAGVVLRDCIHSFCRDCIVNTVKYSEEAEVKCPYNDANYSCDSLIQEREIRSLMTKEEYDQHLAISLSVAEHRTENAFHCKTPSCKGWCVYEDNVNQFKCPICKIYNCLTCRVIHDGLNCKQYQDRMNSDCDSNLEARRTTEMLNEMIDKGEAMKCPICQVVLMKKWGCDWLKCSMCKTEICWVTRGVRWGPEGKGDTSAGCKCGVNGVKCHPKCNYCH